MSNLTKIAERIIGNINDECAGLDSNERAMVLLLVNQLTKCAVELDVLETIRPSAKRVTVVSSIYDELADEFDTELSCGHHHQGRAEDVKFCSECGARVVFGM